MKQKMYTQKIYITCFIIVLLLPAAGLRAQICQDPTDTVYGLNLTGVITPINVNNATIGTNLDSLTDGNTPINSNGIGFSKLNGRFYYFERSAAGSAFYQRFVYYDPTTATVLGRLAPPFSNTSKCRSGCMNTAGNGYYTIDPAGASGPTLYYFNALANTWTAITSVFKDPSNVDISATFVSLNSGDMAFDGNGNLWILCSNTSKYGLYKISAPVTTSAVASITATQIIAPTTATPIAGFSITGLAFNATGALYLSTGSGDNKLYKMTTAASPLTLVGTLPKDGVASDLTSCSYPMAVLASNYLGFETVLKKDVELSWTVVEDASVASYLVEHSTDGGHWSVLASLPKNSGYEGGQVTYHYTHAQYAQGTNFYRIAQLSANGKESLSDVKLVNTVTDRKIYIGPNPASDILHIFNYKNNGGTCLAQVFDRSGRLLYYTLLEQSRQDIDISSLPKGSYILRVTPSAGGIATSHSFIKQ